MPDITMCTNKECPIKHKCFRYTAKPGERQSWSMFKPSVRRIWFFTINSCHYIIKVTLRERISNRYYQSRRLERKLLMRDKNHVEPPVNSTELNHLAYQDVFEGNAPSSEDKYYVQCFNFWRSISGAGDREFDY